MSVGFIYVMLTESLEGLVKIGKSKYPAKRAKQLSVGVPSPFRVAYVAYVSDSNLAERRVHEELKQFREGQNREVFKISSTKAVKVIRRIAKEVNGQISFPVPPQVFMPRPPVPLYVISFTCEGCGKHSSNTVTVEYRVSKVKCPSCQHENNLNIAWS